MAAVNGIVAVHRSCCIRVAVERYDYTRRFFVPVVNAEGLAVVDQLAAVVGWRRSNVHKEMTNFNAGSTVISNLALVRVRHRRINGP
jgi:hypothetical protein